MTAWALTRKRCSPGTTACWGCASVSGWRGGGWTSRAKPGKGTCLLIHFPLENADPAPAANASLRRIKSGRMSASIRILVADDHLIIRQGLRLILETQEGFELVGEAADGAEALRLCAELHPDVVLMDLRMPGMDGLAAIERLRANSPASPW